MIFFFRHSIAWKKRFESILYKIHAIRNKADGKTQAIAIYHRNKLKILIFVYGFKEKSSYNLSVDH